MGEEVKQAKRAQLLEKGAELFYEHGYNATGVQEIVEAAGVPKGSFYTYFDSKESFAVAVLEDFARKNQAVLYTLALEDLPPLKRIVQLFTHAFQAIRKAGYERGCLAGNICQEMAGQSSALRKASELTMRSMEDRIRGWLEEAQRNGQLKGRDPGVLARFLTNSWEGCLLRLKSVRNDSVFDDFIRVVSDVILA
ncbi:MAG: TetR family transcriptional regulator C-terminal domain-containing protein [Leptospirales bacterium]|nr:TetR family transcriptional regulator C-terminal domain-containing protein [Leptospirales bacterium]